MTREEEIKQAAENKYKNTCPLPYVRSAVIEDDYRGSDPEDESAIYGSLDAFEKYWYDKIKELW